jgi:predicted histone-like DNA-binding protein
MIKIVPVSVSQPGVKGGGNYNYCGRISGRDQIDFDRIADTLNRRTTLSRVDVAAAIEGFREIIVEELMAGNNVKLDRLGIFSLTVSTEVVDDPSKLNEKHIRDVKIRFRPDPELKRMLKTADFQVVAR